jgi:2-iminobutanoate/2-iminopropanoate deaminase
MVWLPGVVIAPGNLPFFPSQNFPIMKKIIYLAMLSILTVSFFTACKYATPSTKDEAVPAVAASPEYFLLRPKLEKEYGYSHAVKIGEDLKISGAVSMDDTGNLLAPGDMNQQMQNCYSDLAKILEHYGYSFDDVVVENVYTTNMAEFINVSTFRSSVYKKQFPTGSWVEVKGLALPGQLIEIEMEAHKAK